MFSNESDYQSRVFIVRAIDNLRKAREYYLTFKRLRL